MDEEPSAKKRRTQRACAACRRRKIKCDGKTPCTACSFNSLACDYDDENRRRNGPEYIQTLEKKIEELEGLLGNTPGASRSEQPSSQARDEPTSRSARPSQTSISTSRTPSDDDIVETIVGASDKPDVRTTSPQRYWGNFAGLSLLQRMRKLCGHVAGLHRDSDGDAVEDDFIHAFDSASPSDSSAHYWDAFALMPSKDRLMHCVDVALDEACCLLTFIDRTVVVKAIDELFKKSDDDLVEYTQADRKSMALIYALLALGRRFEKDKRDVTGPEDTKNNVSKGLRYFRASRSLLDVADCHDVTSLQTVLCMIIFLQASSMMSACYSYICAAVAASLRLGLHVPSVMDSLPEHERRTRICIFTVINTMDTYVTTALGLPKTLRDVDSSDFLPDPQRGQQRESAKFMFDDPNEPLAGTQVHAKLITILARAVDTNHPVTKPIHQKDGFYGVEYWKIAAIEADLDIWYNALPESWTLGGSENRSFLRSQLLLRMAYAHVQMVLYRPFLHHAAKNLQQYRKARYQAYACGSACVKAAMQVVWLAETLESHDLFNEANWFVALIVSFAATILMLFVLSNEGDSTIQETTDAAERIKDLLVRQSSRSVSAKRCSRFLQELIDAKHMNKDNPAQISNAQSDFALTRSRTSSTDYRGEDISMHTESDVESHGQTIEARSYPRLHPYLDNF